MYYYLYKITNKIDEKIYIGCHQTKNLNDGYMGSGKYLRRAIAKHGVENFEKEILEHFKNKKDMFKKESIIVNETFIGRKDTYNLCNGSKGGFNDIDQKKGAVAAREKRKKNDQLNDKISQALQSGRKKWWDSLTENERVNWCLSKITQMHNAGAFIGKTHSEESKQKMSNSHKGKHVGEKNSQYGTCWIYSLTDEINKKIKKDELTEYLSNGWVKGRKMKN